MSKAATIAPRPLQAVGLGVVLTSVIARCLFPSEDADAGSGLLFTAIAASGGLFLLAETLLHGATPKAGLVDLLWVVFGFWIFASSAHADYQFPARMMAWEWSAAILVWLYLRTAAVQVGPRALAFLLAAVAVGEAATAWHQVRFEHPEQLAQLNRGDPQLLAEMRRLGFEGFAARARLEALLPQGTFGHTNSLGGFLALGATLLVGTSAANWRQRARDPIRWFVRLLGLTALCLTLSALWLTQCRSALVGFAVSLSILLSGRPAVRAFWRLHWWKGMLLGLAFAAALAFRLDGGRLTAGAKQSLGYRLEWWAASLPIIAARPLFGVGFGNFRDYYLAQKPAYSSEEIADPHNFLVELAACAGIPAALMYLLLVAMILRDLLSGDDETEVEGRSLNGRQWAGAAAILLLAAGLLFSLNVAGTMTIWGGAGLALGLWAVSVQDRYGEAAAPGFFRRVCGAALAGLHVHLLAAGGIGFPAATTSFLALAALSLRSQVRSPRRFALLPAAAAAFLALLWHTAFLSMVGRLASRDQILAEIRTQEVEKRYTTGRSRKELTRRYELAARRVPEDAAGWLRLAAWRRQLLQAGDQPAVDYELAVEAIEKAIQLEPRHFVAQRELAWLHWQAAGAGLENDCLSRAATAMREAVQLYPNSATLEWDLGCALVLAAPADARDAAAVRDAVGLFYRLREEQDPGAAAEASGRTLVQEVPAERLTSAKEAMAKALELDAATPHLDKRLRPGQRRFALTVAP